MLTDTFFAYKHHGLLEVYVKVLPYFHSVALTFIYSIPRGPVNCCTDVFLHLFAFFNMLELWIRPFQILNFLGDTQLWDIAAGIMPVRTSALLWETVWTCSFPAKANWQDTSNVAKLVGTMMWKIKSRLSS